MIIMNKRTVREISPQCVTKPWTEWLLIALVLFSLSCQLVLHFLGSRRKYIPGIWCKWIVWLAYTPADRIATACISFLTKCQLVCEDNPSQKIRAFWAPILLLHLGGPDTITAYSLDDNKSWGRNFVGLLVHSALAALPVYNSLFRCWKGEPLNFLAIPIFAAGLIKYGERTWFQWSASDKRKSSRDEWPIFDFINVMKSTDVVPSDGRSTGETDGGTTDGGLSCPAFMAEYDFEKAEGCCVSCQAKSRKCEVVNVPSPPPINKSIPEEKLLQKANKFFPKFKDLFTDVLLEWSDVEYSKAFFKKLSSTEAFRVIEIELGFVYDTLYTKAGAICDKLFVLNRFFYLSSTISTFVGFLIIDKPECATIELIITLVLLGVAFVQEVYSIILLCSSNWTMSCLSKEEKTRVSLICQAISSCRLPLIFPANKEWSDSMVHLSLVSSYQNLPSKFGEVRKFSYISQMLEWYYSKNSNVPKYLKRLIFDQIQDISKCASDIKAAKQLCALRGERTLQKMKCCCRLGWSIGDEFDKSILLWHLATYICYYADLDKNSIPVEYSNREASKLLSEYMVHLLVKRPFMLPAGIGEIRFRHSGVKAINAFQIGKPVKDRAQAYKMLLEVPEEKRKEDRSKSVLNDVPRLVRSLQCLETEKEWGSEKKWEMMRHMWVEMLCYAACHCPADRHAEELTHGGELLTHVWFLMAHFGITENLTRG